MKKSDKISSMKDLSSRHIQHVLTDAVDYLRFPVFDQYGVVGIDAIKGRQNNSYSGEVGSEFRVICDAIGADYDKIACIHTQIHSDICVRVDDSSQPVSDCDGLMTNVPGIVLVTREADCVPILIYDPVRKAIANVHSGWRGTVKHIVRATIGRMHEEYDSNPADLICALLPSIGMDHFFVHDDVRLPFEKEFDVVNVRAQDDGFLLNEVECIKEDLIKAGVKAENIVDAGICTTCESDQIHSARAGAERGRNAAIIYMKA